RESVHVRFDRRDIEVELVVQRRLVDVRQEQLPAGGVLDARVARVIGGGVVAAGTQQGRREHVGDIVVVVQRQAHLLHVVFALRAASGFAGLLNRGQQQGDEDGDDRDHHQQLNQCKAGSSL